MSKFEISKWDVNDFWKPKNPNQGVEQIDYTLDAAFTMMDYILRERWEANDSDSSDIALIGYIICKL